MKYGDLLEVEFWDHTEGEDDIAFTHAVGFVIKSTKKSLLLLGWDYPESPYADVVNDVTRYSICKDCIICVIIHNEGRETDAWKKSLFQ